MLFFNQSLKPKKIKQTQKWVQEVVDYLIAHGGTYYLPYQHFATRQQFQTCYPGWKAVTLKKQVVDPANLFANGFYKDYLTQSPLT